MELDTEIKKGLELNEVKYWSALYLPILESQKNLCGIHARMMGSAFIGAMSAIDILAYNRVIGLGIEEPATERQIDEIIAYYQEAGIPRFFVQVSPFAQPHDLGKMLERKGFSYYNNWVKLYRKADDPLPPVRTELHIVEVEKHDAKHYGEMIVKPFDWPDLLGDVFARTVGKPGYRYYFAMDGDTPVAAAALYTNGIFGSMVIAGTQPEHRGKGAQSALLAKRIEAAKASGCKYISTETAEEKPGKGVQSYRNMKRFGFEVAYLRPNYIWAL